MLCLISRSLAQAFLPSYSIHDANNFSIHASATAIFGVLDLFISMTPSESKLGAKIDDHSIDVVTVASARREQPVIIQMIQSILFFPGLKKISLANLSHRCKKERLNVNNASAE